MLVTIALAVGAAPPPERGGGLVASDHRLASEAGAEVLAKGGNAVDAAVATALAAGVVQPAGSGIGGGGFAVVVGPSGTRHILDFREVAPAAAHRDLYRTEDGGVDAEASRIGGRAVAVPGESRGLARLLETHGRLSPREVAAPAQRLAKHGFVVGAHLGHALHRTDYDSIRTLFSLGSGVAQEGDTVQRPQLARTLRRWAATGGESLHTGPDAAALAATVGAAGGILTEADLAAYTPKERTPITTKWRGYTIVTMPPPSSGGVFLVQMLDVLEGFDLESMGHNSSAYIHLLTETMKHAYADRANFLGDPDFVEVPVARLTSDERVQTIQKKVWPARTFEPSYYGELIEAPKDAGTQHISVIDAEGLAVSLTTTINTSFGSGVVVDGLGMVLNNEMDDFAAAPGVPNAYGLLGSEANAVEAGKRPLSSMTPTVVLDAQGKVVLAVGASGGPFIISSTLQAILNVLVFDMDPSAAVAAPRAHHQWQPDSLMIEGEMPQDVRVALEARGHTLREIQPFSSVQLVKVDASGDRVGASDPRKGGWPAGTAR